MQAPGAEPFPRTRHVEADSLVENIEDGFAVDFLRSELDARRGLLCGEFPVVG
jgi:hypothetical protein